MQLSTLSFSDKDFNTSATVCWMQLKAFLIRFLAPSGAQEVSGLSELRIVEETLKKKTEPKIFRLVYWCIICHWLRVLHVTDILITIFIYFLSHLHAEWGFQVSQFPFSLMNDKTSSCMLTNCTLHMWTVLDISNWSIVLFAGFCGFYFDVLCTLHNAQRTRSM